MKSKLECPVCHKTIHVDKDEVANYRCEDCDVMLETTEAVPEVCGTCRGKGYICTRKDYPECCDKVNGSCTSMCMDCADKKGCPTCTKQEEAKYGLEMCECCRDFEKCKKDGLVASSGFCPQYKHIGLSDVKEEPKAEVEFHYKLQTIIERIQRNAKSVERRNYCDADKMVAVEEIINFNLTREQSAYERGKKEIMQSDFVGKVREEAFERGKSKERERILEEVNKKEDSLYGSDRAYCIDGMALARYIISLK